MTDQIAGELQESEQLYQQMFNEHSAVKLLIDPVTGRIVQANPAAAQFYGYPLETLHTMNLDEITLLPREQILAALSEAGQRQRNSFLFQQRLASGEVRDVEVYSTLLHVAGRQLLYAILHDITARQHMEVALLESEKRFRAAQDLSLDGFTILRSVRDARAQIVDFEWTYANPAAGRILKQPPEKLIGQRLLKVLPGNRENEALFERYARIVESGQGDEIELEYRAETITGWFRNLTVKLDDGVAVSFSDITPRKQAEFQRAAALEALRASERKYQTLFSEMIIGSSLQEIICDERGHPIDYVTLDVNPEFERLLNVPRAAVLGVRASAILPPAELDSWLKVFGPVALTGLPARYRQDSPINHKIFEGVVFCPQPGRFAVMFEDVTERKRAEERLSQSEERFRIVAEFTYDWEYWRDQAGRLSYISPACYRITGYTADEFVQDERLFTEIIPPADRAEFMGHLETTTAAPVTMDFRIITRDGQTRWINHVCQAVYSAEGHWLGRRASNRDITDRKQMEAQREAALAALRELNSQLEQRVADRTRELAAANQSLAEANLHLAELSRLKDEFIARLSHELRNPLTNVGLYLKLLEQGQPEKRAAYFHTLHQQVDRLHHLIEDLLDVSHLTLDTIEVRVAPLEVTDLLHGLMTDQAARALERGLTLTAIPTSDRPVLTTDRTLLRQALSNVLTNALSYTPRGGTITLRADRATTPEGEWVRIEVRDTGPGISAEDLPHIFEPFYRGAAAADYKIPGTGVGLAIAQRLLARLGGRITVESTPGQGAAFIVWLPANPLPGLP